jgi:hypothetical protein
MICNCGATVKASACGRDDPFFWADPKLVRNTCPQNGHPGGNPEPIRQECGTIDVRSNADTITSGEDERCSPLRSNNIRRSKALERRNG